MRTVGLPSRFVSLIGPGFTASFQNLPRKVPLQSDYRAQGIRIPERQFETLARKPEKRAGCLLV